MHYGNKSNFEGLLRLAEEFDKIIELQPLASYCRLRERGLRRDAFRALDLFLDASRTFDNVTARLAAVKILESNARTSEAHQFLAQPLVAKFLFPTLQAWMNAEPNASIPVSWLGIMSRDYSLLEVALFMCPDDNPVRKLLIERQLSIADWATHHLDESVLLGSVEDVTSALMHARTLITSAPRPDDFVFHNSEIQHFCELMDDWQVYSASPEGAFPDWCAIHGRKYNYPVKIYYEPKLIN